MADRLGLRDDAGLARRIGHLVAAFDALWALTKRNVSEAAQTGIPGIGGSVFKLSFSEHAQALGDLALEVLDRAALTGDPLAGPDGAPLGNAEQLDAWFKSISLTIAAGTSQVQRNIVAERILGLPKAPLMDFRVGEDQRELAEGIRAMVAGRLPLEHLRAREGDERAIVGRRLGCAGRDGRVRPDRWRSPSAPASDWPTPSSSSRSSGAAPGAGAPRGHVPRRPPRGWWTVPPRGGSQVGVHCAGAGGPVLVEHLASLEALLVLDGGRWALGAAGPTGAGRGCGAGSPRPSTR